MRWTRWTRWLMAALVLPASTSAQRLIDLPAHTTATAEAAIAGLPAVFWNPAGVTAAPYQGAALAMNLSTPNAVGVSGIIAAGAYRTARLTFAAAWEHVGINNIPQTEDSPTESGEFSLGEDHFSLVAAHELKPGIQVGATAQYIHDDLSGSSGTLALGAGIQARATVAWPTTAGAYVVNEGDEVIWKAGLETSLPQWFGSSYRANLSYGIGRGAHSNAVDYRLAAGLDVLERASLSAGVTRHAGAGEIDWAPLLAASLRLNRYTLGAVRESLAGDFGATYSFRLQVGIGPCTTCVKAMK